MPELPDTMYCSEQICIPPTFPFLLRQYAKAAIRTQPIDLLKWSAAYFRCLSLNIPPPVKTRLEYPLPTSHYGITPGWLKALIYQLQNNQTIPFKILWDRWTGACLKHETLIQILCLGGFNNANAIPWLRFIALCAAHLTNNLTESMILICEILTEEPEGGSAMITVETFLDLYQFLAKIDASNPQIIKNKYFLDSLLVLWKDREQEVEQELQNVEEAVSEVSTKESTVTEALEEEEVVKSEASLAISCPNIIEDQYPIDDNLEQYNFDNEGEMEDMDEHLKVIATASVDTFIDSDNQNFDESEPEPTLKAEEEQQQEEEPPKYTTEEEKMLQEDLERLKALQQEMAGETDDELEKFKCRLIEDMPISSSQQEAFTHYQHVDGVPSVSSEEKDVSGSTEKIGAEEASDGSEKEEKTEEEVYIDKVPGIGPAIGRAITEAVVIYMRSMAVIQHGMVMPRNIRHYNCPPLEYLEY